MLSNFLGRGTDAIESFLLERKCIGIDINPSALALSQRNISFSLPRQISAEYRPLLLLGDARSLSLEVFTNERFDHILSHPPYKDCVIYSEYIDGDLSRVPDMFEFQSQMALVAKESFRVLKMNKRCTLAMGDNRKERYFQPISFQTIKTYMNQGFELEELVRKV